MTKIIGVIPARYQSSRLPGKSLALIGTRPMIQWVYEQASKAACLSKIFVATDDSRIENAVRKFGGNVVMTSHTCQSGTDRVAEAVRDMEADIVINIQGDEPFIHPKEVDLAADILIHDSNAVMSTLVKRISHVEELISSHTAKVIVNQHGYALYFSRQPIPFCRNDSDPGTWLKFYTYYKHIGIYAYRKNFLHTMTGWDTTPLEQAEKLEQLRVLEHGILIKVAETDSETLCVDTPEDLEKVREIHAKKMYT
ncbi:3-deoxy-manno-octulosonate cytidylyltransferase [bacterium]|nr:3-deoxy-manno-octulosonate cytidylyltransferase [bacterium]